MLTTGYTLVGKWYTPTSGIFSYQIGTFYANGTVNQTASTLANIRGPVHFFPDVNGAMWVGWTDVDNGNYMTYAGYLAKLQGQINVAVVVANVTNITNATVVTVGAYALSTVLALVAFLLASIVAY